MGVAVIHQSYIRGYKLISIKFYLRGHCIYLVIIQGDVGGGYVGVGIIWWGFRM